MAHTVSGKLRKAPFVKNGCGQDGQSDMYIIELAEVIKDYQTQEKSYTNYKAMFFAKSQSAKDYYAKAFAEGSFVVVSCEKLKVDQFAADNGNTYITLMMENARLEGALPAADQGGNQGGNQQGWGKPQQPQAQQQMQQQPQQHSEPPQSFDSDIPFGYIGIAHSNNLLHVI